MLKFQVVTWNVHGVPVPLIAPRRRQRFERIAQKIMRLDPLPDAVLLQEVFCPSDVARLAGLLPCYHVVDNVPRRAFPPWFLPGFNLAGIVLRLRCSGLLAFIRHDWEVILTQLTPYLASASPLKLWEGDGYARKGFQHLVLRRSSHEEIALINTHLQADYRYSSYQGVREQQLRQLAAAVQLIEPSLPTLVAGDLNVQPHEELYSLLTMSHGWQDLLTKQNNDTTVMAVRPWYDYVFAKPSHLHYHPGAVEIITNKQEPYSDHPGLVVTTTVS